jgi:putative heme-binding domain-containing protein
MPFYELRDNPLTSRQQILIAGVSCLVISILAAGAVSQSPPRKANSDKPKSSAAGVSPAPRPDQARGKRLFEGHCARCHGMQGGGGTGANLRRSKLQRASDDESLFDLIRSGIPESGMPDTWAMTDNEVRDVIAYVRALGRIPPEPLPGDPDKGQLVYRKWGCSTCHIVAGKGGSLGPDLSDIGSRRGVLFLRRALLHPGKDRAVTAEGYTTYLPFVAVFKDGRVLAGARVNEDTFTIQLRDTSNRLYSLQKSDLEALHKLDVSVMPSYGTTLSATDIDNVVSYLASLKGKP